MRLINSTNYDGRTIRGIITSVFRRYEKLEHKGFYDLDMLRAYVVYRRTAENLPFWTVTGEAFLKGHYIKLFLDKSYVDVRTLAYVIEHELEHCFGYQHRKMAKITSARWENGYRSNYDWAAEDYGEMLNPRKPRTAGSPVLSLQERRYQRLCEREKKWVPKYNRAKNALAKIREKKRYYEKQMAAKGKGK